MVFVGRRLEVLGRELAGRDVACWRGRCTQGHRELADSGMGISLGLVLEQAKEVAGEPVGRSKCWRCSGCWHAKAGAVCCRELVGVISGE